jgi:hypothetical protein
MRSQKEIIDRKPVSMTQRHSFPLITTRSSPPHTNTILSFSSKQHPQHPLLLITTRSSPPHTNTILSFSSK